MKTYDQAVAELKDMTDWLKVSNGAFQYLRITDCYRFMDKYPNP